MRAAIPTELLLRLMNATPEQYTAVERVLGMNAECEVRSAESSPSPTLSEDVARSAFALLVRLDVEGRWKSPSPLTVFRLYCVDGLSAGRVARKCCCGKATVIRRLRFIEARTGVKAEQFRTMSAHLQQIDDELHASGAREIYRRGLIGEDEN